MSNGIMGRPPKPTALKLLQGTARPDRMPKNEPKPELGAPTRPNWLLPEAKREWSRIVPELLRLGILAKIDRAALAARCQCWAMYVGAIRELRDREMWFETEKSYCGPHPLVGIAVKMLDKLAMLDAKFGLTPADRARLDIPIPETKNAFEEYLELTGKRNLG